jgi:hypothetical protein
VDLATLDAAMDQLAADPGFIHGTPVICDLSDVTTMPVPAQTVPIARRLVELVATHRVALVVRSGAAFAVARTVSTLTREQVEAFSDCDTARRWLTAYRRPPEHRGSAAGL